jgi:hypothetical protein
MTPAQAFGRTLLVALVVAVLGAMVLTSSAPAPQPLPTAPVASLVPEPVPMPTLGATLGVVSARWGR